MKDVIYDEFQDKVDETLNRHTSILDIISKLEESNAKVNRSTIKSITRCGCLNLNSEHKTIPQDTHYEELKNYTKNQLSGELCPVCREKVEEELGNHMFYLSALCNALNINLYDVLLEEYRKLSTLGKFSLY